MGGMGGMMVVVREFCVKRDGGVGNRGRSFLVFLIAKLMGTRKVIPMAIITIVYGSLLVLLGLAGYFGSDQTSLTALIPLLFGIPLEGLGLVAYAKPAARKHAMHAAAVIALLGLLGTAKALLKLPALIQGAPMERPAAVAAQCIMAVLSLIFLALCVRSFMAARKARAV